MNGRYTLYAEKPKRYGIGLFLVGIEAVTIAGLHLGHASELVTRVIVIPSAAAIVCFGVYLLKLELDAIRPHPNTKQHANEANYGQDNPAPIALGVHPAGEPIVQGSPTADHAGDGNKESLHTHTFPRPFWRIVARLRWRKQQNGNDTD